MDTIISLVLAACALTSIEATPNCVTNNEGEMVCTPGDPDYILGRGLFSNNDKATNITLRGCHISDIEDGAFQNLLQLKYLDLSQNRLTNLKLGVFNGITQITYLNLSYNLLSDLPSGLFEQNPNLDFLDLKGNSIKTLELGVFNPLEQLTYLDLSSNRLVGKELNPYIFDKTRDITYLDLSRNDLWNASVNLLHAFRQLEYLNLDRCFLKEIPEFLIRPNLKTVKELILTANQIQSIDSANTFANFDNMDKLYLSHNMIESLNEGVFWPMKNLRMIILSHNKLKSIPEKLFKDLPELISINLSKNKIEYVPVEAFRRTAVKYLHLSGNRFTYLESNFCLELRNSGTNLSKFFFDRNPWQCACLNDLLKEVKQYGIAYNSARYTGTQPVCVVSKGFFNCVRQMATNGLYVEMYDDVIG